MALPSQESTSTAAGNTIGGAVKYVTAPPSGSGQVSSAPGAAETVAGSQAKGATQPSEALLERLVGGAENRKAIKDGAGLVVSGVKALSSSKNGNLGDTLAAGAVSVGTSFVDGVVGGAQNRKILQQGAEMVFSGAKDLFNGKSSLGDVAGDLANGAVRTGTSIVDGLVGAENREVIMKAAGSVYDGAKDLLTGKKTLGELFSGGDDTAQGVVAGKVGGVDVSGIAAGKVGGAEMISSIPGAAAIAGREGSDWGGLSKHLMARIYACDADGIALSSEPLGISGPVTDVSFDSTLNWQSPFESFGPEAKAPALMATLQAGALVPVINAIQAANPIQNEAINSTVSKAKQVAKDLEGLTGITKLNSRQVFAGVPPLKVTLTMHFRAMSDPVAEVVEPYQRLLEFAMPQGLAADGVLTEVIASTGSENSSFLKAMFPSVAPVMVGLVYANNRYPAMVVESISNPLDGPMDSNGRPIYRAVHITLSTLTALDRADIKKLFV